jgi:hypothetical protein
MTAGKPRRGALKNAGLALAACLLSLSGAEAGYRYHLYRTQPARFQPLILQTDFFQRSPWLYNETYGWDYQPGETYGGTIADGVVISCWRWLANERGNVGRVQGSYEDADLKVLVFGDSWTSQPRRLPDGTTVTWPDFLQDELEAKTGGSVHVVNFARDASGVLQMFDMARVKLPEWKPDLAVVAFITDDLTRARSWRTTGQFDGAWRVLTALSPAQPPNLEDAAETAIVHPNADPSWCRETKRAQSVDDPIAAAIEQHRRQTRGRGNPLADPFSLSQSFLFDAVVRGNPTHTNIARLKPAQNPRHSLRSFADDDRTVEAFKEVEQLGIPVVLVHLAYFAEIASDREVIPTSARDESLWHSLEKLHGGPIYNTLDHVERPVVRPEELSGDFPRDHHPSLRGLTFYGQMVAELLTRHGYVN